MRYKQKKINVRQLDGTYKQKTIYANSYEELNKKCDIVREQAEEIYQQALKPKFSTVAKIWNIQHETEIGTYTYDSYQAPLNNLIDEFGDIPIEDIKPLDLQRFINNMHNKGYAKHTIALRKITASLIFDFAIINGYITYNPASVVKVPKNATVNKRELPSDSDIEKVKQSLSVPFGLFAYLCLYTGCRRGEALALTYEDIDFKNNLISINKVVVFNNGQPVIEHRAKSNSGIRYIPLLVPLKNVLNPKAKGYVFPNSNNELMTLSNFNSAWRKYKQITGINLSPHQLRHAFATICFDAGLELKDTASIMGHSKVELTMNVYTHIKENRKSKTAAKLNSFLTS